MNASQGKESSDNRQPWPGFGLSAGEVPPGFYMEEHPQTHNPVQQVPPTGPPAKKWWRDPAVIAAAILSLGGIASAILSRWP